jgi:cytochrome c oxidase subunit I+III
MEWVKAGPDGALPVSTVVQGKHPPYYYGTLLFILIETVEFGALIASYFYLRSSTNDWPPGDTPMPELLAPGIATLILLLTFIPTYLGDHAIKKNDERGLQIGALLTALGDVIYIAFFIVHLARLSYKWPSNAYSSVYWTLIGSQLLFAFVMLLENLYILLLARQHYFNAERHWAVEIDGYSSYLVIALGIVVYLVVFVSPYLLR